MPEGKRIIMRQFRDLPEENGPSTAALTPEPICKMAVITPEASPTFAGVILPGQMRNNDEKAVPISQPAINSPKKNKGFKELLGVTLFTYLTDIRMEKAKELLLDGNSTIREVAEIAGYSYPRHFTTAFKKKFGFSPQELKK